MPQDELQSGAVLGPDRGSDSLAVVTHQNLIEAGGAVDLF
jgi:hypothetical protein